MAAPRALPPKPDAVETAVNPSDVAQPEWSIAGLARNLLEEADWLPGAEGRDGKETKGEGKQAGGEGSWLADVSGLLGPQHSSASPLPWLKWKWVHLACMQLLRRYPLRASTRQMSSPSSTVRPPVGTYVPVLISFPFHSISSHTVLFHSNPFRSLSAFQESSRLSDSGGRPCSRNSKQQACSTQSLPPANQAPTRQHLRPAVPQWTMLPPRRGVGRWMGCRGPCLRGQRGCWAPWHCWGPRLHLLHLLLPLAPLLPLLPLHQLLSLLLLRGQEVSFR